MSEQDLNEHREELLKKLEELCKQNPCQERVEVLRKLKVVEKYLFPFWLKEAQQHHDEELELDKWGTK